MHAVGRSIKKVLFACYWIVLPIMLIGIAIAIGVLSVQSSLADMRFQQTHPIVRATILSVFTQTSTITDYDPSMHVFHTYTETETCAETIQFLANGQQMKINVKSLPECGIGVGDQREIAYDPHHPSHLQFVPAGDPVWGAVLRAVGMCAFIGFALTLVMTVLYGYWIFRRRDSFDSIHPPLFWWVALFFLLVGMGSFVTQVVLSAIH